MRNRVELHKHAYKYFLTVMNEIYTNVATISRGAADPHRPHPCVVANSRRGELVHWGYGCGLGQARLLRHYTATGMRATSQLSGCYK